MSNGFYFTKSGWFETTRIPTDTTNNILNNFSDFHIYFCLYSIIKSNMAATWIFHTNRLKKKKPPIFLISSRITATIKTRQDSETESKNPKPRVRPHTAGAPTHPPGRQPSGSISPAVCRCCTFNVDNFQWWRRGERPRRRGPGRCAPERGARGRDMSEPPGPGGHQRPPPPRSPRQSRMGPAPFASFEDLSDEVRPKVCTVPPLFLSIVYIVFPIWWVVLTAENALKGRSIRREWFHMI